MAMNLKRRYFNELAPRWDALPAPLDATDKVRHFVERAVAPDARLVLDIGGGTGILLPVLLEKFGAAARLVELDLAENMLAESARKFSAPWVLRLCADARYLPLRAESADLILCFGVLPHLGEAGEALRGLMQVLRPGGALAVGHLMGSRELNALHASLDAAVAGDRLPSAGALAEIFHGLGATAIVAEEYPDWYFVRAEKQTP